MSTPTYDRLILSDSDSNKSVIGFPTGIVLIFHGNRENIPLGWALCDGANDTPDLRGRFVLGSNRQLPSATVSKDAEQNVLSTGVDGTTGGNERNTISVANLPRHSHTLERRIKRNHHEHDGWDTNVWRESSAMATSDSTDPAISTSSVGGGGKDQTDDYDIMPPFYAMAYIMKI